MRVIGYKTWETFKYKGKYFICISRESNEVEIYGKTWDNYGLYYDKNSFKKFYVKNGESLNLTSNVSDAN